MNFNDIVNEELATDLDAIKGQIKALQATIAEKDAALAEKDKTIQDLQKKATQRPLQPQQQQANAGIGTRKPIVSPQKQGLQPAGQQPQATVIKKA